MLARSFHRASKSIIDASVGVQEFIAAICDEPRKFCHALNGLAASTFARA